VDLRNRAHWWSPIRGPFYSGNAYRSTPKFTIDKGPVRLAVQTLKHVGSRARFFVERFLGRACRSRPKCEGRK
jgi:hypothetical protein